MPEKFVSSCGFGLNSGRVSCLLVNVFCDKKIRLRSQTVWWSVCNNYHLHMAAISSPMITVTLVHIGVSHESHINEILLPDTLDMELCRAYVSYCSACCSFALWGRRLARELGHQPPDCKVLVARPQKTRHLLLQPACDGGLRVSRWTLPSVKIWHRSITSYQ